MIEMSGNIKNTTFSSLFIGMGLAICFISIAKGEASSFQFPFHRDGPCDGSLRDLRLTPNFSFSSLFIGMGLAISGFFDDPKYKRALSVPFSSGWALR